MRLTYMFVFFAGVLSSAQAAAFSGTYLGVTGEDLVGAGSQSSPDGVSDIHIRVDGFTTTPRKVYITGSDGFRWRSPYYTGYWVASLTMNGTSGDLFFEPSGTQSSYTINAQYWDGTQQTTTVYVPSSSVLSGIYLGITG